jgi:hypothetical protein
VEQTTKKVVLLQSGIEQVEEKKKVERKREKIVGKM